MSASVCSRKSLWICTDALCTTISMPPSAARARSASAAPAPALGEVAFDLGDGHAGFPQRSGHPFGRVGKTGAGIGFPAIVQRNLRTAVGEGADDGTGDTPAAAGDQHAPAAEIRAQRRSHAGWSMGGYLQ